MNTNSAAQYRFHRLVLACAMILALVLGVWNAAAQQVVVRFRPLTPQEIKNAGLPASTQKSGGAPNVGLGQPVYAEALVQTGTVVVSVDWSILSAPPGSTATILPSPLSNAVPTYDGGDKISLFVADRKVIKPDVPSFYDFGNSSIVDYKIKTDVVLTNKTISVTNAVYGATFLGQKHYLCVLCHADKQANYDQTAHATAFTRAITGESTDHFQQFCISCHVLGYDTTAGATNGGFDDVAAQVGWTFPSTFSVTNWTSMNTNLQMKANVQCENCHGPASAHMTSLGSSNAIDVTLSAGTCGQCHDSIPHHVKNYEWGQTMHATGYVFRFSGACVPCHSSVGFIETWDPYYVSTGRTPRATAQEGIACAACHDPHTVGMGDYQLRNIPQALLSNGVVITYAEAGQGVLCMNCHHGRREANSYVLSTAGANWGPHYSVQADMLKGENAIEYGMNMPSSRHLTAVSNSCVGCHMQLIANTQYSNDNTRVGGHTFRISWDRGTTNELDDVKVTEVCSACHVEQNTFDFGGEDYDRDGMIEGVQSEIHGLLEELGNLLPPAGPSVVVNNTYNLQQRKAAYNYLFVEEDQSHGVHNPKYAAAILQASIDDLRGGIDVDRDGLVDTWEMAKFGSLTAQVGSGDADNDGLTNEMEEDLGTNPNLADSDGDGYSDLAEVQANSNPMVAGSNLSSNTVIAMESALEISYMPAQAGITQVFQTVDAMGDDVGWTNAGPAFVSSNSPSYQLISVRDSTNKFFRVIKP